MDTGETEVAAIVSAEGYEYNGACPPDLVLWLFVPSYPVGRLGTVAIAERPGN